MKHRLLLQPDNQSVFRWLRPGMLSVWLGAFGVCGILAQDKFIAYEVPTNTIGNQAFDGVLGMEFEVANPVIITRLGAFDDGSDGMKRAITVRLYDRSDEANPVELASLVFSPDDPGDLVGGSRFKLLASPLNLGLGFKGTITAENYGAEERLRNTLDGTGHNWQLNDGQGSIRFTGNSRFGLTQGLYPDAADVGPADRYAAGTFEFQTTPPLKPGKPSGINLIAADGQIQLRWQEVTNPLPAVKYQIYRAENPAGASNFLAEVTVTEYVDQGLSNGQVYSYYLCGIGANGSQGEFSARVSAAPYTLASDLIVAYFVPPGKAGTQTFGGVLGMDFTVVNPIIVTQLGVFDDGSDGLKLNLIARLYNRTDPAIPVEMASIEFTPDSPGTLIGGTRFKDLPQPLRLEIGFQGTIATENYGPDEKVLNSDGFTNRVVWTLNDGGQSIAFVGTSRYGTTPGAFPDTADGGPAARYAAGSFIYKTTPAQAPGTTVLSALRADRTIRLSWTPVEKPLPAVAYRVYEVGADGQTNRVAEITTTEFTASNLTKGEQVTYLIRAVAVNGQEGADSNVASLVVEAREPGIAYQVEANTLGNETFGGMLGMDFDVVIPIRITRLGVFDDSSDGLFLPITARLFNRTTAQEVAQTVFTPENSGNLTGGSRFLDLTNVLVLPAGFKGTIAASGYGEAERFGNRVAGRTVFSAADAIQFIGTSRYGVDPVKFPDSPDGGPFNRYAAGTFYFEPLAEQPKLSIQQMGSRVTITWTGTGTLESAAQVTGTWNTVPNATSGLQVDVTQTNVFYRVRMQD